MVTRPTFHDVELYFYYCASSQQIVDMSLHKDTLSWPWANYSIFLNL